MKGTGVVAGVLALAVVVGWAVFSTSPPPAPPQPSQATPSTSEAGEGKEETTTTPRTADEPKQPGRGDGRNARSAGMDTTQILKRPPEEVVDLLNLPPEMVRTSREALVSIAARALPAVRQEYRDLIDARGDLVGPLTLGPNAKLRAEKPVDERCVNVVVNDEKRYLCESDAPELFAIDDALHDLPGKLVRTIVNEAIRNRSQESPPRKEPSGEDKEK